MRSKLIKSVLLAVCCIVIYSVIYNYTTQINSINKNNTYESDAVYKNYRIDYINKYVETIKTNNYQGGFNMLDDDAKKYFNDNLVQYSEYIINPLLFTFFIVSFFNFFKPSHSYILVLKPDRFNFKSLKRGFSVR